MRHRDTADVRHFLLAWQSTVADLLRETGTSALPLGSGLVVGRAVLYPCTDAVVALIYKTPDGSLSVESRSDTRMSVAEFTLRGQAMRFYDQFHHWQPGYPAMSIHNDLRYVVRRIGGGFQLANHTPHPGLTFSQRFDNALAIGWDADLSDPQLSALEHFQLAIAARNVGVAASPDPDQVKSALLQLASRFREILVSASNEEEIQAFLKENPILLCPSYSRVEPKFKLGKEFVTDFAFVAATDRGTEWVFVEIERSSKRIFTQAGHESSAFAQAKNQLVDWELWIAQHPEYISHDFPGLFQPTFHLVIGRDSMLSAGQKDKLRLLARPNQVFSTYDDLVLRYEALVMRMLTRVATGPN